MLVSQRLSLLSLVKRHQHVLILCTEIDILGTTLQEEGKKRKKCMHKNKSNITQTMFTSYTATDGSLISDITLLAQNSIEEYTEEVAKNNHATTRHTDVTVGGEGGNFKFGPAIWASGDCQQWTRWGWKGGSGGAH